MITRFAPSPTGHLHKGHAWSALTAFENARQKGGKFLLRIEDIDFNRCKTTHSHQILEDLDWLGIEWEEPVRVQSEHIDQYSRAATELLERGLLYPCFCTRKDIQREIKAAGQAPQGSEGPLYPGTCKHLPSEERAKRIESGEPHALRLDLDKAMAEINSPLTWADTLHGPQEARPEMLGDIVIVRKDIGTSYHLAVVFDDGLQQVTEIVRGVDLFDSTHIHCVLQKLLGLPTPTYHHHRLLTDENGNRLAKRDRSITLKSLRDAGITAKQLKKELGFAV
ncbi:MAG: tRNA glutamyl-Q(34) synthetase GluQRS [Verrucomicrobiales bacterium]|nr:tRNA glutamyl-Q(34) synthetase GluQRS [Verrucomicrobiales bacterium]|tara:strand:- start:5557 stop:6396 length:840 start_codon:yes stop_codon:yes gene_type:complete